MDRVIATRVSIKMNGFLLEQRLFIYPFIYFFNVLSLVLLFLLSQMLYHFFVKILYHCSQAHEKKKINANDLKVYLAHFSFFCGKSRFMLVLVVYKVGETYWAGTRIPKRPLNWTFSISFLKNLLFDFTCLEYFPISEDNLF